MNKISFLSNDKEINKKDRNQTIDILRGIATLMVILGHAIQRGLVVDFQYNIIFRFIYTFHMPLFMILAGYTLYLSHPKYDFKFVKNKVFRLLYPLIIWSYIIYFMRDFNFVGIQPFISFPQNVWEYTKTLLVRPDYIIWFIYALFVFNLVFLVANKMPKAFFLSSIIIFEIIVWFLPIQYFGIYFIRIYLPFFVLGYYLAKYKDNILPNLKYYVIPCIIFYCLTIFNWQVGYENALVTYMLAISSMIILYVVVKLVSKKYISKSLMWIGRNSLYIYLCQCVCLNIGIGTGTVRVITIFISATIISVLLTIISTSNKFTKLLLYGQLKK
jgi:fucose 4-O-acetylase-like acetyltransferase